MRLRRDARIQRPRERQSKRRELIEKRDELDYFNTGVANIAAAAAVVVLIFALIYNVDLSVFVNLILKFIVENKNC